MTENNATPANNIALPKFPLDDLHTDAILLAEMLEGIDLMNNEGAGFDNARIAITIVAAQRAKQLADDMERAMK